MTDLCKKLLKEIQRLENELGLDFGIAQIRINRRAASAVFERIDNSKRRFRIVMCPSDSWRETKELLYHELGHAFRVKYGLARNFQKYFYRRTNLNFDKDEYPPMGYISEYATDSQDEDFCEVFSALLMNNRKTRGWVLYEDIECNLNIDPILRKKFEAVNKLINRNSYSK